MVKCSSVYSVSKLKSYRAIEIDRDRDRNMLRNQLRIEYQFYGDYILYFLTATRFYCNNRST